MPETDFGMSVEQLLALMLYGIMALVAIVGLVALVRLWSMRMQKSDGGCGGIDMARIRRLRDAGEITQAEYEAVVGRMAGTKAASGSKASGARPERPINNDERGPPGGQKGSDSNGQG
jgi:hypothetical protein